MSLVTAEELVTADGGASFITVTAEELVTADGGASFIYCDRGGTRIPDLLNVNEAL